MSAAVALRRGRAADAAAIARVYVATWRAAYAGLVPDAYLVAMTEAGQARQWGALLGPGRGRGTLLVAETPGGTRGAGGTRSAGGTIVGFGSCGPARPCGLAYRGEVYSLYVDGDWQNRGIGRALLEGLFEALRDQGLPSAVIWVLAANPSRFFYRALGGTVVAERHESFAGTSLAEAAYGWPDLAAWRAARQARG